jgi:peptidoglycan/LPS O-acetylase OafA/YrhL
MTPTRTPTPADWSDLTDPRRNNFDALRFLLAVLVVFSHSYTVSLPKELWAAEPVMGLTGRQASLGTLAVYGFFAVSGFLIAQSWVRSRSFGQFLKKRALRLYPGFAVMTLACVLVVVPLAVGALPTLSLGLLGKVAYRVLVFDAWEDPAAFGGQVEAAVNASAWTIPYEFWCYLFLAAVGAAGALSKRWGVAVLASLFAAFYGLHQWFALAHVGPVWADVLPKSAAYHASRVFGCPAKWPEFLTYFVAGMLFFAGRNGVARRNGVGGPGGTTRWRLPHSGRLAAACAAALVAAAMAKPLLSFALPVCGVYLLFWVALHPKLRLDRFGARGDVSYGVYLYAFPIQQLLVKWIGPATVTPMVLFACSLPLALAAGVLSWHGVEKWFVHRRKPAVATAAAATAAGNAAPAGRTATGRIVAAWNDLPAAVARGLAALRPARLGGAAR